MQRKNNSRNKRIFEQELPRIIVQKESNHKSLLKFCGFSQNTNFTSEKITELINALFPP